MNTMCRRLVVGIALVGLMVSGLNAAMGDPQQRVRLMLDSLRSVLMDQTLKTPDQQQKLRNRIHQILEQHVDFLEMARRSLGRHWFKITPDQQRAYLALFSQMIAQSFVDRIVYRGEPTREGYGSIPDTIQYTGETIDADGYASVQTVMTYPGETTQEKIDYLLFKRNGQWWVYDTIAEAASTLTNYRSQFDKIIRQESFAGLMQRLTIADRHR